MEKLRLNDEEKGRLIAIIMEKLNKTNNINSFNFNKADMDIYLKGITTDKVKPPLLCIPSDVYVTMLELVKQSKTEISWHGLVKRNKEEGIYLLYDILIFPQINTATTTTTDETEFAKWQTDLLLDDNFPIEDLRMHGHSHVMMNVFSSGVDDQYQSDLISKVYDGDFYLFMIMNKKMEICTLLYDFEQQMLFNNNDIEIKILDKNNSDIITKCNKMITDNCTEPIKSPTKNKWNTSQNTLLADIEDDTIIGTSYTSPRKNYLNYYGRRYDEFE